MRKAIFWDFDGTLTVPHHMWSVSLLKALGPLAEEYGITWEKIRPFTHSGFPWDEDGAGHLTGQAWWDCMLEKFSHAYLHFGIPKAKVFPVPVGALAITSFHAISGGIASACTRVG